MNSGAFDGSGEESCEMIDDRNGFAAASPQ
jgi:hypothetical protein